ncbi:dGTP triphosphohydrolase [Anaerosinus massiliensis]|uniref:dGTP triphosphohydrolase n=1 Tax=Massilibacillus massiliensis TaxID=1806837 RepID=UPI000B172F4E|nr:dNTP triphosphohydrolase [Massilibacillus massiliensis]
MKYDWHKLLSTKRQRPSRSTKATHRNEFDKDYDRIISSSSVRRLQDKAQVFPLQENDFTRTRLTHSLEASAIARSLGLAIGDKLYKRNKLSIESKYELSSLLAVAGLIHDLGNPPFGHYGETIIRQWFKKWFNENEDNIKNDINKEKSDLILFEGNAQTLRIVSKLQFMNDQYGVNFTYGTLASIIKYPWDSNSKKATDKNKFGYFVCENDLVKDIYKETGTGMENNKNPITYILEAADDISYILADIEDGVKKGLIKWDSIYEEIKKEYSSYSDDIKRCFDDLDEKRKRNKDNNVPDHQLIDMQNFKVNIQGILIIDCVDTFIKKYDLIMNGTMQDDLLKNGKFNLLVKKLKDITYDYCFKCKEVLTLELVGETVICGLLDLFVPAIALKKEEPNFNSKEGKLYSLISENFKYICWLDKNGKKNKTFKDLGLYEKLLLITDFVTGMTDSYAVNLYKRLIGVNLP